MLAATGCKSGKNDEWKFAQGWDVRKAVGMESDKPEPPQTPIRLVSSWTQAVHHSGGAQPKRGFGGRIVFFSRESDIPVRVEGQLVVYAFDETDRAEHETHPTKRFIFPPEQFVRHESTTKLGSAYSVWLPWDDVGGPRKNITLITRFEPADGALVIGEPTKNLLPGTDLQPKKTMLAEEKQSQDVQLASYKEGDSLEQETQMSEAKKRFDTATFQVPKGLSDKLANAKQAKPLRQAAMLPAHSPVDEPARPTADQPAPTTELKAPGRRSLRAEPLRDSLRATLPAR
ncbi:hypothetical protein HG15A2_18680 [Adhaeretor mobilis]|uniref:Uncharacterized protein n=2 Tax=Adhaeretor mobilis TaxID=1930276 RepID=A0A517MUW6_9BACT|nr:hypothetical protein HG15A2_18680 [Adhaeretor mobilis]